MVNRNIFYAALFVVIAIISLDSCSGCKSNYEASVNEVDSLNDAAYEYRNTNPDLALTYAHRALHNSIDLRPKYDTGKARSLNNIGLIWEAKGEYAKALDTLSMAEQIYDSIEDTKGHAIVYTNIAMLFKDEQNYDEAIEYTQRAKTIDSESVYNKSNKKTDDKTYNDSIINRKDLAIDYLNLGDLYETLHKFSFALSLTDSGLSTANALLQNYKINNKAIKIEDSDLAGIFINNLGNIYYDSASVVTTSSVKDSLFHTALEKYKDALLYLKSDSDIDNLCEAMTGITKCYIAINDRVAGKPYANASLSYAKKNNNNQRIIEDYELLAIIQPDSASYYLDSATTKFDSLSAIAGKFISLSMKEKALENDFKEFSIENVVRIKKIGITIGIFTFATILILMDIIFFERKDEVTKSHTEITTKRKVSEIKKNKELLWIFVSTWTILIFILMEIISLYLESFLNSHKDKFLTIFFSVQVPLGCILLQLHHFVIHAVKTKYYAVSSREWKLFKKKNGK